MAAAGKARRRKHTWGTWGLRAHLPRRGHDKRATLTPCESAHCCGATPRRAEDAYLSSVRVTGFLCSRTKTGARVRRVRASLTICAAAVRARRRRRSAISMQIVAHRSLLVPNRWSGNITM